jgi:hypothetical protein
MGGFTKILDVEMLAMELPEFSRGNKGAAYVMLDSLS